MSQAYSDPSRESDEHSLPDLEVFELTASEVASMDEDLVWEYGKRHEFRLASMNSKVREAMVDAIVSEEGIEGGWFYWHCFPGCLPDGSAIGPYESYEAALEDARGNASVFGYDHLVSQET
jgi:hypothetical protein